MEPPSHARHRGLYLLLIAGVIGAGLASRSEWLALPPFVAKYAGDSLWAVMVFLGLGLLLPTRGTARVAVLAAMVCVAVECSQLYHAPWIDAVRRTWLGRMALGGTFAWGDIVAYLVGIGCVGAVEWATCSTNRRLTMRHQQRFWFILGAFGVLSLALGLRPAAACTRAVYLGKEGQVVTGRSMDWLEDMQSNLWVFPRGMKRDGGMGAASLKWTSKHGSVITSVYEAGTADGMNEKGLVANMLYLAESEYPPPTDTRPAVVIAAWTQYVLDSFATVEEAVAALKKETFRVVPTDAPNGAKGTVHLSISDAMGDSAILEYIKGKLVVHHGRKYQVMTNSPVFDEQIALNKYWEQIGGTIMLPGTNRAADRFARASFYINACKQSADPREAVASVFSVMRNVSVPRGIGTPAQPNISSTIWRTVSDHKNRVYYFEDTASPSLLWVKLDKIDFKEGSGTRKLTLVGKPDTGGDQTGNFAKAEPFKFLAPPTK